jgi:hypothetical protein
VKCQKAKFELKRQPTEGGLIFSGEPTPDLGYMILSHQKLGQTMVSAFIKLATLTGLIVITLGVIPDRRTGALIAVGTCVVAAFVLHFVAP